MNNPSKNPRWPYQHLEKIGLDTSDSSFCRPPGKVNSKHTLSPFEHGAGVGLLVDPSHHPTVLQGHALQQPIIHVVPNADGEDAELLLHGRASVPQDRRGLDLPDSWPPVGQENNEGHAVGAGVGAREVTPEQRGAGLDGVVDVRAWSGGTPSEVNTCENVKEMEIRFITLRKNEKPKLVKQDVFPLSAHNEQREC